MRRAIIIEAFLIPVRRLLPVLLLHLTLLSVACMPAKPPVRMADAVIDGEVLWEGEVRIAGVVIVPKEGRLTIAPGTRILFERIDRDGDGIGDAELLVEGALLARGTPEAPILFTSAEAQPRAGDWKYLYFDFARQAQLERVISEYAFSGVQVHFCRARIVDSIFRHNVDGVRFSTAGIEVAGNRIYGNTHGLRYEERRSEAHIHHNDIRDNEIGIFAVTRSEDRARIERNNIVGNRRYNVKLGLQQHHDITLPRNYWGSPSEGASPTSIEETFFDQTFDRTLGRVAAPEPLAAPVDIEQWQQRRGGEE